MEIFAVLMEFFIYLVDVIGVPTTYFMNCKCNAEFSNVKEVN